MTPPSASLPPEAQPWHVALAYALLGVEVELGLQVRPDPAALIAELRERGYGAQLARVDNYPVPERLRRGLGAAQFLAALQQLRALVAGAPTASVRPRAVSRTPDPGELRLRREVPPHW